MQSIRRSTTDTRSWRRSSVADVFELFDEYAAAYARGEHPRAGEYLERAGPQADELAGLIDEYLKRADGVEPTDEARAVVAAVVDGGTPLLELRVARGLRRAQVVGALMKRLAIDPAKEKKVAGYYHELEGGLLEPTRVDKRVWNALAETLTAKADDLARWRPATGAKPATAAAYLRAAEPVSPLAAPSAAAEPAEPDEVDALFHSGG
jgi:hypothetical protein